MFKNSLQNSFVEFCHSNKFEINNKQIEIVKSLEDFLNTKKKLINFFSPRDKHCFYLYGSVGVGKTMIVSQVYNKLRLRKWRLILMNLWLIFMISDKESEENSITKFVNNLKKIRSYFFRWISSYKYCWCNDPWKIIWKIFKENIKIIITTNTKLVDLYKDGLQRTVYSFYWIN